MAGYIEILREVRRLQRRSDIRDAATLRLAADILDALRTEGLWSSGEDPEAELREAAQRLDPANEESNET